MINELMTFRKSLASWGVVVPKSRHIKLNKNSNNGTGYIVYLDKNGIEEVAEFPGYNNMCCFVVTQNQKIALSFKFELNKSQKGKISGMFEAHEMLYRGILKADSKFDNLKTLIERLNKITVDGFESQIREWLASLGVTSKDVYLSLELAEDDSIQTQKFMDAISDEVFKHEFEEVKDSNDRDMFGNPIKLKPGKPDYFPKIKTDIGLLPAFSRNEDRPSYSKFGLNSTDTFPLGPMSRAQITDTVLFIFQNEKRATAKTPGVWHQINLQSGKGAESKYFVITSLFPSNQVWEVGRVGTREGEIGEDEWEVAVNDLIQSMQQQKNLTRKEVGQITVISESKGAWHVDANFSMPIEEICDHTEDWFEGFNNGPMIVPKQGKALRSSIVTYLMQMNVRWKQADKTAKYSKTKDLKPQDAYNLLFGRSYAAEKAAIVFAERHNDMLLQARQMDKVPYQARFLVPIRNLILHKLGYSYDRENKEMDHWAWHLGAALMEANKIYKKFFEHRRSDVPKQLIGQRYVGLVSLSPRNGVHQFLRDFTPALVWAQQKGVYLRNYQEHFAAFSGISETGLPVVATPAERLMINAGYLSYSKYTPKVPSSDEVESQQETETVTNLEENE